MKPILIYLIKDHFDLSLKIQLCSKTFISLIFGFLNIIQNFNFGGLEFVYIILNSGFRILSLSRVLLK